MQKNAPIQSFYELQYVLGFTKKRAQILSLICILKQKEYKTTPQKLLLHGQHKLSSLYYYMPISYPNYYTYFTYPGNALKTIHRYRYSAYNKLNWGITLKNDMGETTQKGPFSTQFDYYSAFIQIKNIKKFNIICIGDFEVKIGQGLILWQGGFFGKYMAQSPIKHQNILRKHSSSNEWNYNRGIATTYSYKNITITPFVSLKKIDGYFNYASSYFPIQLYTYGYHRTASEIKYKKHLNYNLIGCTLSSSKKHLKTTASFIQHSISQDTNLYKLKNISLSYYYHKPCLTIYGETAVDNFIQTANIHGIEYNLNENISGTILLRKFDKNYQSLMSASFSEQSQIQNEKGLYISAQTRINKHTLIFAHDRYASLNTSLIGNESLLRWTYKDYKKWSYNMQIGFETKNESNFLKFKFRNTYIINSKLKSNTTFIKNKNSTDSITEYGYLINQSLQIKCTKKLHIILNYSIFNAPSQTYIYNWEYNVQYANSSSQILYGGKKYQILCTTKITPKLQLQIRASLYKYNNKFILPEYYSAFGTNQKITSHINFIWIF